MDAHPGLNSAAPSLSQRIREACARLGFDAAGIVTVSPSEHAAFYRQWLEQGRHGGMHWLARPDAVTRRADARAAWPEVRSAIVVAVHYAKEAEAPEPDPYGDVADDPSRAIIARYAQGRDYHHVMRALLLKLLHWLEHETGHELPAARACVDTSPVFERELAQRAGLGWFGRNTMLIHPRRGSYFFLGVLFVELALEPDAPFRADHCGSCHACIDACPTGALLGRNGDGAPVMDARRCISYLTIEHRGPIPHELREAIGQRVFGCDICQEVCPFTRRFAAPASEPAFAARPDMTAPQLIDLMGMSDAGWDEFSRGSAVRRARRAGFLRNVAIALGNWGSPEAVPALVAALADPEPLVRGHAAWALGRIGTGPARSALAARRVLETDAWVAGELRSALERSPG